MKHLKIIVEKHCDGFVSYPIGINGIVIGQGNTYEEALEDVKSALHFHVETFGKEIIEVESSILEAFIADTAVDL